MNKSYYWEFFIYFLRLLNWNWILNFLCIFIKYKYLFDVNMLIFNRKCHLNFLIYNNCHYKKIPYFILIFKDFQWFMFLTILFFAYWYLVKKCCIQIFKIFVNMQSILNLKSTHFYGCNFYIHSKNVKLQLKTVH